MSEIKIFATKTEKSREDVETWFSGFCEMLARLGFDVRGLSYELSYDFNLNQYWLVVTNLIER